MSYLHISIAYMVVVSCLRVDACRKEGSADGLLAVLNGHAALDIVARVEAALLGVLVASWYLYISA